MNPVALIVENRELASASNPYRMSMSLLKAQMDADLEDQFSPHPFSTGVTRENVRSVARNYLTMSLAFPYLQAGASQRLIADRLMRGEDVSSKTEATCAVGAFLVSDEFGVHARVLKGGAAALPDILQTGNGFHANLLRADLRRLFGEELKPAFTSVTRQYLHALDEGLSSFDDVRRAAHMIAFERHAAVMIESLWERLKAIFDPTDRLVYFETHVGGDDPAEPYHVAMTERMIATVVDDGDESRFLEELQRAYALNFNWCREIC